MQPVMIKYSKRYRDRGVSLVEVVLSLLVVAVAAGLLVRANAANGVVSQQSARRASAFRLASELSAWVQRGGHLALGMPLDQALDLLNEQPSSQLPDVTCCLPDACDSNASAWHYLALWQDRFRYAMPDARWEICSADMSALDSFYARDTPGTGDEPCGSAGQVLLMKLDWPASHRESAMLIPLGITH